MFVLPDAASLSIGGVELVHIVFSSTDFSCALTETLNIILSYKLYFTFLCHKIYIYYMYEYICIYVGMLELYI